MSNNPKRRTTMNEQTITKAADEAAIRYLSGSSA